MSSTKTKILHQLNQSPHCQFQEMEVKATEDFILSIAKYPIHFAQLNGYLTLCIRKSNSGSKASSSKTLTFSFLSFPFILFLLNLILTPLSLRNIVRFTLIFGEMLAKVQSDSFMLFCFIYISFSNLIFHKILALFSVNSTLSFWRSNCELLSYQWFGNDNTSLLQSPRVKRLQSNSRRLFIGVIVTWGSLAIVSAALDRIHMQLRSEYKINSTSLGIDRAGDSSAQSVLNSFEKESTQLSGLDRVGLFYWTFFSFIHPLSFSWATVFIKIYCISLLEIVDLVNNLVINQSGESRDDSVNKAIQMSENIYTLMKHYNRVFSFRLLAETVVSLISLLGLANNLLLCISDGEYSGAATFIFPFVLISLQVYHISCVGSDLKRCGRQVVEAFYSLPSGNLSTETQWKVRTIL